MKNKGVKLPFVSKNKNILLTAQPEAGRFLLGLRFIFFFSLVGYTISQRLDFKVVPHKNCGDVREKFQFLKIQELRPLNTRKKHFEITLQNLSLGECEI